MESLQFASFTYHLGIPAVTLCVALINRMDTDQVTITVEQIHAMEAHPGMLMRAYIQQAETKAGYLPLGAGK
jgi:hypothetical protein